MPNKFVTMLDDVGRDFKKGLDAVIPYAQTAGEAAVAIYAPSLSPLFNQTVNAVVTAEQAAAAVGKQSGTGTQKLSSVVSFIGPLIAQALADVGKANDQASVQKYVKSVVSILNSIPSATPAKAAA
jgi:hypothetical protein